MYGLNVPLTKLGELEHGFINDTDVLKGLGTQFIPKMLIFIKNHLFQQTKIFTFWPFLTLFDHFLVIFDSF